MGYSVKYLSVSLVSLTALMMARSVHAQERNPRRVAGSQRPMEVIVERTTSTTTPSGAVKERTERQRSISDGQGNSRKDLGRKSIIWRKGDPRPVVVDREARTFTSSESERGAGVSSRVGPVPPAESPREAIQWDAEPPELLEAGENRDLGTRSIDGVEASGHRRVLKYRRVSTGEIFLHSLETWVDSSNRPVLSILKTGEDLNHTTTTKYTYNELDYVPPVEEFNIPPGYTEQP